jgi:long-chain acyl-CoA synthetase
MIADDDGNECPAGVAGAVYMRMTIPDFVYKGDPAKTGASRLRGYFTVGDIGYLDADGFLFLCDRKSDMIISGGANIYPAEIEAAIIMHPQVADVAVFGVPDPEWGESVKAVVEPAPGAQPGQDLAADILASLEGRLSRMKWPRSVDFITAMPRDPSGKLLKRRLREPYWDGTGGAI